MAKVIDYSSWTLDQYIPKMAKLKVRGKEIPADLQARFDYLNNEYMIKTRERLTKLSMQLDPKGDGCLDD